MTRALANDSRIIRLPVHTGELLRTASHAEQQLESELGREPTLAQVAGRVGIDPERLQAIRMVATIPGSLDAPRGEDSTLKRADVLVDEAASDALQLIGETGHLEPGMATVIEELPEREREVVKLHYGLANLMP